MPRHIADDELRASAWLTPRHFAAVDIFISPPPLLTLPVTFR
jgi:hypothetical protein